MPFPLVLLCLSTEVYEDKILSCNFPTHSLFLVISTFKFSLIVHSFGTKTVDIGSVSIRDSAVFTLLSGSIN